MKNKSICKPLYVILSIDKSGDLEIYRPNDDKISAPIVVMGGFEEFNDLMDLSAELESQGDGTRMMVGEFMLVGRHE